MIFTQLIVTLPIHRLCRCLVFVAGISVLTMLINAVTLEMFINLLGLGQPTAAEEKVFSGAQRYLEKVQKNKMDDLQQSTLYPELVQSRWDLVQKATKKHVGFLHPEVLVIPLAVCFELVHKRE